MKLIKYLRGFGFDTTSLLKSLGALLLVGFLASCSERKPEKIVIRGSNTVGEELAPQLIVEYAKEHPAVIFDTEFKGTTYGFGALMTRHCDIAAASREVSTNEIALGKDNGVELKEYVIGSYSVTVIVNKDSPVSNLTPAQVRDIFTGTVQNWKEVGGPDAAIHLYIRNPISGTYLGFQEVAMDRKPYAINAKAFTTHAAIAEAVVKDPNGIGYSSLDGLENHGVKMLSIGGVAPTIATVTKGEYPYARVLRLYTDKAKESAITRDFVQFVQSAHGQKILEEMGFAPKP